MLCFHKAPGCGLIHRYAGSSVQRMTGRNMQNHSHRKKKSKKREKAVRVRGGVLDGLWVYLHIGLQRRKTHPDTPHWEDKRKSGGGRGFANTVVHSPKTRVDQRHNTAKHKREKERERKQVVISHPCSMQRTYNFHLGSTTKNQKLSETEASRLNSLNRDVTMNGLCSVIYNKGDAVDVTWMVLFRGEV